MKKSLLLSIIALFTFSLSAQTSTYHPFPDSSAVWNFNVQMFCFSNGQSDDDFSIIMQGDTLINNKIYQKLNTPAFLKRNTDNCTVAIIGYKGATRNDLANKKVYIVPKNSTTEVLLYDFDLQLGDTLKGFIELNGQNVVVSIDSILVGNSYRKRWKFDDSYNFELIEGVGSTYGLIEGVPGKITDFPDYSLMCFEDKKVNVNYPASSSACAIVTSVNELTINTENINVYPNPSNGFFKIDLKDELVIQIRITDILGKVVIDQIVGNDNFLKYSNFNAGTYIISFFNKENQSGQRKLVIY